MSYEITISQIMARHNNKTPKNYCCLTAEEKGRKMIFQLREAMTEGFYAYAYYPCECSGCKAIDVKMELFNE